MVTNYFSKECAIINEAMKTTPGLHILQTKSECKSGFRVVSFNYDSIRVITFVYKKMYDSNYLKVNDEYITERYSYDRLLQEFIDNYNHNKSDNQFYFRFIVPNMLRKSLRFHPKLIIFAMKEFLSYFIY